MREHGKSRVASNLWKYATSSLPIILRAMRDIQPLKFFGGISAILLVLGILSGGFVSAWYLIGDYEKLNGVRVLVHKTSPFTSLITVSGVLFTLAFLLFALALLADMHSRVIDLSKRNDGEIFIAPASRSGQPGGQILTGWPLKTCPPP